MEAEGKREAFISGCGRVRARRRQNGLAIVSGRAGAKEQCAAAAADRPANDLQKFGMVDLYSRSRSTNSTSTTVVHFPCSSYELCF